MTPHGISLNDAQLEKIITTLSCNWWSHWFQVASIFVSAFLGYMSGIALEHFKNRRVAVKAVDEQQRHQVAQIKAAIAGIAFNIKSMRHAVFQNVLPHHKQSYLAYKELQTPKGDDDGISQFAIELHNYPALMMTCPEMHFVERDFFKELPFLVEKDPELLKQGAGCFAALVKSQQGYIGQEQLYSGCNRPYGHSERRVEPLSVTVQTGKAACAPAGRGNADGNDTGAWMSGA